MKYMRNGNSNRGTSVNPLEREIDDLEAEIIGMSKNEVRRQLKTYDLDPCTKNDLVTLGIVTAKPTKISEFFHMFMNRIHVLAGMIKGDYEPIKSISTARIPDTVEHPACSQSLMHSRPFIGFAVIALLSVSVLIYSMVSNISNTNVHNLADIHVGPNLLDGETGITTHKAKALANNTASGPGVFFIIDMFVSKNEQNETIKQLSSLELGAPINTDLNAMDNPTQGILVGPYPNEYKMSDAINKLNNAGIEYRIVPKYMDD